MKIYGRTLGEIYGLMPPQYRALMIISAAFLLFIPLYLLSVMFGERPHNGRDPLYITGLSWEYSSYDPVLVTDPRTRQTWMAFSNILDFDPVGHRTAPGVRTAVTDTKDCAVWRLSETAFKPADTPIYAPDGVTTITAGTWRYETPALVFDPDDAGHEWKAYAYKYFWNNDNNMQAARRYGMIAMHTTSDPDKGWSEESLPFGANVEYPPAPYQDEVRTLVAKLDPALADITMVTRPSAVYAGGTIYMTLSAFTTGDKPDRVIMIASKDHGATWTYLGAPLNVADAARIKPATDEKIKPEPYTELGGATLLLQGDKLYLAAVFGTQTAMGAGTFIFGFDDLTKAHLRRDASGAPVLLRHIPRQSAVPHVIGGGYAAYTDACPFGILTGEYSGKKNAFQLFKTFRTPDGQNKED